jgi:hypothetical protein
VTAINQAGSAAIHAAQPSGIGVIMPSLEALRDGSAPAEHDA